MCSVTSSTDHFSGAGLNFNCSSLKPSIRSRVCLCESLSSLTTLARSSALIFGSSDASDVWHIKPTHNASSSFVVTFRKLILISLWNRCKLLYIFAQASFNQVIFRLSSQYPGNLSFAVNRRVFFLPDEKLLPAPFRRRSSRAKLD